MPFWINSQRNAPTGSKHTPTPGPASKRTRGPVKKPKVVSKSSSKLQTPSPGSIPPRGQVHPHFLRHKEFQSGNQLKLRRSEKERQQDLPKYKSPNPEDKHFVLPIRGVGYKKPGTFGSLAGTRISEAKDKGDNDPNAQARRKARNEQIKDKNAKARDRKSYNKLIAAGDQHVVDFNKHVLRRQRDWTRHLRRSQGYKHPYQGKIPGQSDQKLFFESGKEQAQGMLQDRTFVGGETVKGRIRIQGKVQMR